MAITRAADPSRDNEFDDDPKITDCADCCEETRTINAAYCSVCDHGPLCNDCIDEHEAECSGEPDNDEEILGGEG